jgi:pyruvate dehydrogenase E1 component alpha subunit
MHLIDKSVGMAGTSAMVGGAVPIATGAALAAQMQNTGRVVMVLFGEATTEEGVMSESLNFAALKRVPIVFLCENNFYSVQSPLFTRQPDRDISRWAATYGVPSASVDGMNVLDVYAAVRDAVARARAGGGPTFIEARVYRYRAHGGAGDDSATGYRSVAERESWEAVCPVNMHRAYLASAGMLDDRAVTTMETAIAAEIADAFDVALASPNPTEEDLYRHVYAD